MTVLFCIVMKQLPKQLAVGCESDRTCDHIEINKQKLAISWDHGGTIIISASNMPISDKKPC